MDKIVKQYLDRKSQEVAKEFQDDVKYAIREYKIESPVEQIFYLELQRQAVERNKYSIFKFYIEPQFKITTEKGNRYRVDFLIYYTPDIAWVAGYDDETYYSHPKNNKKYALIVEIDSYLWHGTSPEQFEKEKKRERDLINEGWEIIRFSGREIMREPEKCAEEVFKYFWRTKRLAQEEENIMMEIFDWLEKNYYGKT
jgi:hypothetical protein